MNLFLGSIFLPRELVVDILCSNFSLRQVVVMIAYLPKKLDTHDALWGWFVTAANILLTANGDVKVSSI